MSRFGSAFRSVAQPARAVLLRPVAPLVRTQRAVPLRVEHLTLRRNRRHVLVDLVHQRCPPRDVLIAEVGTRGGRTTEHVLTYCPQVKRIYAVDIVAPGPASPLRSLERVEFLLGPSVEMSARLADGSLDLVFIDADHSEAAVRQDIATWRRKLRRGGVLAGHDYGSHRHVGVKAAVDDIFRGHHERIRVEADKVWWTLV
jgi:predicted O-methyltransferase YrrM